MSVHSFGRAEGEEIVEIRLESEAGARASILTWGAVVRDLQVPTAGGELHRVVLGFRNLEGYLAPRAYHGSIAGRHANRIAQGRFTLDGQAYQLDLNERGITHLHGGARGFPRRPWRLVEHDRSSVLLALNSPDGDMGYPGAVEVTCRYRLEGAGTLAVELAATTDRATPINLAHHSYFTLTPGRPILDHRLTVAAGAYTPVDGDLIPTGEVRPVAGTDYDFRSGRSIGGSTDYDINFALDGGRQDLRPMAWLEAPDAPVRLEMATTEPGLQFYDGKNLVPGAIGLEGTPLFAHAGLCLEAQTFPDGPNHPNFPPCILRPGETYRQLTEYRFLPS